MYVYSYIYTHMQLQYIYIYMCVSIYIHKYVDPLRSTRMYLIEKASIAIPQREGNMFLINCFDCSVGESNEEFRRKEGLEVARNLAMEEQAS